MGAPVMDVSELLGKTVRDQSDEPIGEIAAIYATGDEGRPALVAVEFDRAEGEPKTVFIALAQLRREHGSLCVSCRTEHITSGPELERQSELSEADASRLRRYYPVGEAFSL
jgi:hypothetical protein